MKATKKAKMYALKAAKIGRKDKKVKGFTLVELIIVIAIIGILAAILIPTMSGKVKESKIQTANDGAAKIAEQAAIAITELDTEGYIIPSAATVYTAADEDSTKELTNEILKTRIEKNVPAAKDAHWKVKIENGSVTSAIFCPKNGYVGTYPSPATKENAKKWGEEGAPDLS